MPPGKATMTEKAIPSAVRAFRVVFSVFMCTSSRTRPAVVLVVIATRLEVSFTQITKMVLVRRTPMAIAIIGSADMLEVQL